MSDKESTGMAGTLRRGDTREVDRKVRKIQVKEGVGKEKMILFSRSWVFILEERVGDGPMV